MKRSGPIERKTALRADPAKTRAWGDRTRKALPPKSTKRKARRAHEVDVIEAVYARDGGCVLRGTNMHVCYGPLTPHHLRKQSAGGDWSDVNVVALCADSNGRVEDEPEWARQVGLVVRWGINHDEARRRRVAHGLVVR